MRIRKFACVGLVAIAVSANAAAEGLDSYILNATTPKGSGWNMTGNDPLGIGAFGVKRFNWIANEGRDRVILFIDPNNPDSPSNSRASDVRAGGRNCKDFTTKTELGDDNGPFLSWVSECTLENGNLMVLRHFAYVKGNVGYKISRIWRESPSEKSLSEWSQTIESIVAHISKLK